MKMNSGEPDHCGSATMKLSLKLDPVDAIRRMSVSFDGDGKD